MVDPERLLTLLGRVTARLAVLDGYAGDTDRAALLADPVRLGHLKYRVRTVPVTAISARRTVGRGGRRPVG